MTDSSWQEECLAHVGQTRSAVAELSPDACNALLATLNDSKRVHAGESMPPLFHWLYFNASVPTNRLKIDGHEKLGDFLPPVPYPRRMWASSTINFKSRMLLGETTARHSTIKSVEFKTGSSGALCFVNVEHCYHQRETLCLSDVHTIVYREKKGSNPQIAAPAAPAASQDPGQTTLSSIELFRYSALTFNSHRIHYDHDYCREVEGYPGLVAHGPLLATLLVRHISKTAPQRLLKHFSFRAFAPVFAGDSFTLDTEVDTDRYRP